MGYQMFKGVTLETEVIFVSVIRWFKTGDISSITSRAVAPSGLH
jgi:hypothetical protein